MMKKRAVISFFLLICMILSGQAKAEQESPGETSSLRPKTAEYKAEGLRDPFIIGEEESAPEKEATQPRAPLPVELTIQGIVWGGAFPQAIVNNQIVKIGDTIQEVRILNITKEGLTVSFQGWEYNLPPPPIGGTQDSEKKPKGGTNENKP